MKRYRVLIDFTDKVTSEKYKANSIIELNEDRANEILAHPSIVAIREIKTRRKKSETLKDKKVGE